MAATMTRPNILFIMSDDHAAHAMSAYGSTLAHTPNLDRIAHEGVRFDNVYCANSICTPSRATILTGQHSHINGVRTLDDRLDNTLETLPKLLQRDGYQTAIIGKWHLGHGPEHDPRGFDHWEVLPGQGQYHDPRFLTAEGLHVREGYVTDIITDLSLEWLESTERDRPFALFCHHKAVHSPWEPADRHAELFSDELPEPASLWDDYEGRPAAAMATRMRVESMPPMYVKQDPPADLEDDELLDWWTRRVNPPAREDRKWKYEAFLRDYLRCAAAIDDNVGRMLDFLDERGLSDNTIVVYTSDQGFFLGDHGWFDKRFMYDESLRMPFLLRWPRGVPAGMTSDAMISNVDFAPTLLEFAQQAPPAGMQGHSFAPLLREEQAAAWPKSVYYRYWMTPNEHDVPPHYGIRTQHYKLIRYDPSVVTEPSGEWELFDLRVDPLELTNVYGRAEYRDVARRLKTELTRLRAELHDEEDYPQAPTGEQHAAGISSHPEYASYRAAALVELRKLQASGGGNGRRAGVSAS